MRVGAYFLDRSGEPFIDGTIHQSVGEPVHHHHRQRRQQERAGNHARAKLRTQHAQAPLGKKLEQVAHQDKRKRDKEQEDQRRESGEDHDVLIVSGAQKGQVKGGLRNQNGEQKEDRNCQQDDDLLAM